MEPREDRGYFSSEVHNMTHIEAVILGRKFRQKKIFERMQCFQATEVSAHNYNVQLLVTAIM